MVKMCTNEWRRVRRPNEDARGVRVKDYVSSQVVTRGAAVWRRHAQPRGDAGSGQVVKTCTTEWRRAGRPSEDACGGRVKDYVSSQVDEIVFEGVSQMLSKLM